MKLALILFAAGSVSQAAAAPPPPSQKIVQTEAREMLGRLISYQSAAGKGSVPAMAEYLSAKLQTAGFQPSEIQTVPLGETAGLIVRYAGRAGSLKKPVVFLAHMDVVDALKGEWATDPWTLTEKGSSFYGRGVVDNKYGVLVITQAFMRLRREGFVPDRDLVIAFTGDEETGMATAKLLASKLNGAAYAINADAGGGYRSKDGKSATYAIQAAEKTYATFELTTRNSGGHSSAPRADNAIHELVAVVDKIAAYRFPVKWNDVSVQSFDALAPSLEGEEAKALAKFAANPGDASAVAVLQKNPMFDRDLRTTCVTTMLKAGIVENALPTSATATVNCRIFPGETIASVQSKLFELSGSKKIEIKTLGDPVESPVSAVPSEVRAALGEVLAVRAPQATVSPYMEAGGTDGLRFRSAGIPTLGVGPLFTNEDVDYNFHGNNEMLPVSQFNEGLDHFYLFIKALAGKQ